LQEVPMSFEAVHMSLNARPTQPFCILPR